METCPCGSTLSYTECCLPVIRGEKPAATAEQLMRSRYSAYAKKEMEYVKTSLHPEHRSDYDDKSTREWAERAEWHGIEIVKTEMGGPGDTEGTVEFVVTFTEGGVKQEHHERSTFNKIGGTWYFTEGKNLPTRPIVRAAPKAGRNDPCPCGSGKKFKKCCA